jgi:cyclohexa-1,5-dienecarbonyl-CoA hydratase
VSEASGTTEKIRLEALDDEQIWRVTLAAPKANILDREMVGQLSEVFAKAEGAGALKAILVEGEGKHFSFGASVEEHKPALVADMLAEFHALFRKILATPVMTLAAVRGQCLGGGLELVTVCNRIFASPTAMLGQPEIQLGVIAPVASVLLPRRVGQGAADDLCISGRSLSAEEAQRIGLVDETAEDPGAAALAYAREHLLPRSASSLRLALRAVRMKLITEFDAEISRTESMYLDELMKTRDAHEGIEAFLERRSPQWQNA